MTQQLSAFYGKQYQIEEGASLIRNYDNFTVQLSSPKGLSVVIFPDDEFIENYYVKQSESDALLDVTVTDRGRESHYTCRGSYQFLDVHRD